jgi:hypothetical protein
MLAITSQAPVNRKVTVNPRELPYSPLSIDYPQADAMILPHMRAML